MDITVDPQVEVASLRAMVAAQDSTIVGLNLKLEAMNKLARMDAEDIRRLKREVAGLNTCLAKFLKDPQHRRLTD